jgi:tRNA(Ile)-lysidine synthase
MIRIQGKIPRDVVVACSGGVDSMAIVDFLRRNHNVTAFYFNHGTEHGFKAEHFLKEYFSGSNVQLITRTIQNREVPKDTSQEEHWRNERYKWIDHISKTSTVITCHHLDDCVETWVWSSMHGSPNIIPYRRSGTIRPFRLNRKRELDMWCRFQNVPWIEDDSNTDLRYTRNYIRHEMMPHVLRVNPGIYKTIAKKVRADETEVNQE